MTCEVQVLAFCFCVGLKKKVLFLFGFRGFKTVIVQKSSKNHPTKQTNKQKKKQNKKNAIAKQKSETRWPKKKTL